MALPGVSEIEQAGLRAWPAIDTAQDGQWVLRAAGGYTNRANSIQCLDPNDDADVPQRLERAVCWYRDRALPPVFRVTPLAGPNILAALEGWTTHGHSLVLAADLGDRVFEADARVSLLPPASREWLAAQRELQDYDNDTAERLRHIVERIKAPAKGLVVYAEDGSAAASALMVVVTGVIYTGNVVTGAAHRRKGYARRVLQTGMAWARTAGARRAGIQVAVENAPAIALYQGLGYVRHYEYHYRRLKP